MMGVTLQPGIVIDERAPGQFVFRNTLTGTEVLVDPEDAEVVAQLKWQQDHPTHYEAYVTTPLGLARDEANDH